MFFDMYLYAFNEKLVCDGGHFKGFSPAIQGDNYGPYQDVKL